MRSGKLRHRIEIQAATEARNSFGELIQTWATTSKAWASVQPMTGNERIDGMKPIPEVDTKITTRYCDNITAQNRIKLCDKTYHIEAVLNTDTLSRELVILAKER